MVVMLRSEVWRLYRLCVARENQAPVGANKGQTIAANAAPAGATPPQFGSAVDFQLDLETETVEHCYASEPLCAAPDETVRVVLRKLQQARTGAAMICAGEKLVGIFTERDALRLLGEGANLDAPVSQVMVENPVTLRKADTVAHAIALMSAGGFRRLPIVDDQGRVRGVLKVSGILHYLVEHFPKVVYTLPPAPHHKMVTREGA
jgi:predicted transcriptional regulator